MKNKVLYSSFACLSTLLYLLFPVFCGAMEQPSSYQDHLVRSLSESDVMGRSRSMDMIGCNLSFQEGQALYLEATKFFWQAAQMKNNNKKKYEESHTHFIEAGNKYLVAWNMGDPRAHIELKRTIKC